jgi:ATP-dependent Clp protease ATP-binding subunit ClpC
VNEPNLNSIRACKARLGKTLGKPTMLIALYGGLVGILGGALLVFQSHGYGWFVIALGLALFCIGAWLKYDLLPVPVTGTSLDDRLDREVLARLKPGMALTPQNLWQALKTHWHGVFIANHLLVTPDYIGGLLDDKEVTAEFWKKTSEWADRTKCKAIEPGHIVTALLLDSPRLLDDLKQLKRTPADIEAIADWLGQDLAGMRRHKQNFGGIGRDWANGFTPRLNQFGRNISLSIEKQNIHFGELAESDGVQAIKAAFSQGASAVALVGEQGIGKTSTAYALAQNLLAETKDRHLEHRQIISLSPSHIISAAQRQGDLEYIVTMLLNEAAHAGNIILFMDDAQLFFANGPGMFDATQILLPVMQSRAVQFVLAMTPHDYQTLRGQNPAFAGLLTPVMLQEPDEATVMKSLTTAATNFEVRQNILIAYEALQAAYRLSGRYEQDLAYPGKAIKLLEQAITHANNKVVVAESVEAAVEQTQGVKVSGAGPVEASQLLSLEDQIHQRMINQTRAVSVVANALRRNRAGVGSPNRPIGSFLFLGPTGVGKTELAKSIAATYFGNESSMIRLDMSEYQQPDDVKRLLASGENEASSLILRVRQQPFSVVLLDEIEKAHPNVLNLLLQLLDEGQLTDSAGRAVSFKDAVVIVTSNAGADTIRQHIEQGEELESFEKEFIDQLISSGQFKPELLNRFDEIVLFRPLKPDELGQVVRLMLDEINKTLATQNISVNLTDAAIAKVVAMGNDPRLGARPMRRALQRTVENTVAEKILKGEANPGDTLTLDAQDLKEE